MSRYQIELRAGDQVFSETGAEFHFASMELAQSALTQMTEAIAGANNLTIIRGATFSVKALKVDSVRILEVSE